MSMDKPEKDNYEYGSGIDRFNLLDEDGSPRLGMEALVGGDLMLGYADLELLVGQVTHQSK